MPYSFSYIVVGGGLYGCAVAFEMALKGHSVAVFEKNTVASGASGGPGLRGVRANHRDYRELPLMLDAASIWPVLTQRLAAPTYFRQTGSLMLYEREVAGSRGGTVTADAQQRIMRAHGIEAEILDSGEVQKIVPGISESVSSAMFCPTDGVADHGATTRAYAEAASRLGTQIFEYSPIGHIQQGSGQSVTVTLASGQRYEAKRGVIVATNGGTSPLFESLGLRQPPLWTVHPQAIVLRTSRSQLPLAHLVNHNHRALSVKRIDDETAMVTGGWRGSQAGDPLPDQVQGSLREAEAVFPALKGAQVVSVNTDRAESVTIDQLPIIDRIPGLNQTFLATGWSGHGFAIAPAVASHLAQWIDTGVKPQVFTPFSLGRWDARPERLSNQTND